MTLTSPNETVQQNEYEDSDFNGKNNGYRNNFVRRPRPPYIEVDVDVAFELMEALKASRIHLLLARAEMVDEGIKEGVQYYNFRLDSVATARRRLIGVINRFRWNIQSPLRDD